MLLWITDKNRKFGLLRPMHQFSSCFFSSFKFLVVLLQRSVSRGFGSNNDTTDSMGTPRTSMASILVSSSPPWFELTKICANIQLYVISTATSTYVETVHSLKPDESQYEGITIACVFLRQLDDLGSSRFVRIFYVLKPQCRPIDEYLDEFRGLCWVTRLDHK